MSFSNYVSHVFVDLVRFSSQIYTNLTFFQGESAMSQLQRNPRKKKKFKKKDMYICMYFSVHVWLHSVYILPR